VDIFFRSENQTDFSNHHPWNTLFRNWAPAVLWAGLIFFFSTDRFSSSNTSQFFGPLLSTIFSGITAEQFDTIHLIVRKLAHWSQYFIFSLLLVRALRGPFKSQLELRRAIWILAMVSLYALSDELHQAFVPSRTASLADVTIDSVGGICGILWTYLCPKGKLFAANAALDDHVQSGLCKKP
jgi:VanZ family protein